MKDAVATMGDVLPADVRGRDAVHVAVVSAVAGEKLSPGQDVSLIADTKGEGRAAPRGKTIGIVDPFLKADLQPDQRFWLFLYPRTITGLRHVWSHPDFPDGFDAPSSQALASEQWIRAYAEEIGDGYGPLMAGADRWVRNEDYYYGPDQGGYHGLFEGVSLHPEFWDHYEAVRGVKVPEERRDRFFTCSC
jgi:hypothetical protein